MKTGSDVFGTAEKRIQKRKTWKLDPAPSVSPKMDPEAKNMKIKLGALSNAENGRVL
jgi:hypothetical protein